MGRKKYTSKRKYRKDVDNLREEFIELRRELRGYIYRLDELPNNCDNLGELETLHDIIQVKLMELNLVTQKLDKLRKYYTEIKRDFESVYKRKYISIKEACKEKEKTLTVDAKFDDAKNSYTITVTIKLDKEFDMKAKIVGSNLTLVISDEGKEVITNDNTKEIVYRKIKPKNGVFEDMFTIILPKENGGDEIKIIVEVFEGDNKIVEEKKLK